MGGGARGSLCRRPQSLQRRIFGHTEQCEARPRHIRSHAVQLEPLGKAVIWPDSRAATISGMRRLLLAAAIALIAANYGIPLTFAQASSQKDSPQKESAPDVPDAIQVPTGEEVVLFLHASGAQIYTCKAAAGDTVS